MSLNYSVIITVVIMAHCHIIIPEKVMRFLLIQKFMKDLTNKKRKAEEYDNIEKIYNRCIFVAFIIIQIYICNLFAVNIDSV